MKILKECITKTPRLNLPLLRGLRVLRGLRAAVLSACVLVTAGEALAQSEKQISYPVAVPVQRAPASSAPSAPQPVKAPTPIIRSIDEGATPPARAKTPVKKSTKTTEKKSTVKTTAKPSSKTTTKTKVVKKPAAKSATKVTAKKATNNKVKKPAPKKITSAKPAAPNTKPTAPVSNPKEKLVADAPAPAAINSTTAPAQPMQPAPVTGNKNAVNQLAVPIVAGAALTSALVTAEEEKELARSLADEGEDFAESDVPEVPLTKAATPPVAAAVHTDPAVKTALPMSNQREAFVTEFKNFVETKVVPKTPGLALAIIADGKVKVLETYGFKKAGSNALINADTTFRLASVSKSFAATAAAMMVNDGLMRWDTKVTDILPNVEFSNPRYGDQMTVQHILSQATGLPTQANSNFIEEGLSFDEVVRRLRYVNFVCPPGKCYNYQNVTYSLIGNIVLKKTGLTYEQYLENKVLRPLGMRTATVGYADYAANNNFAVPHLPTRKGWAPTTVTEHYYRVNPAAGVNASITDMSRWLLAHMGQNPSVLSPSILNAVHAKITRNTPAQNHYGSREGVTNSHYGLGWRVFDYRGDKNFIHHGGGVKGFRSEMVLNPELKIGMVILTNGPRLSGSVIFEFLDAYEDEKRGERKKEAAAPVKKKKK